MELYCMNRKNSKQRTPLLSIFGQWLVMWTFLFGHSSLSAFEFSPRVVYTKQTQWQGVLGPINLRGYGFSPGQYHHGVEIFRGIPYANPPVSQLRYESPSPIALLSNKTYIANETKFPCPKQFSNLNVYKGPDLVRRIKSSLNQDDLEDCLYLDVYVPRVSQMNSGSGLPVLVYANSHSEDPEDPFDGSSVAAIGKIIVVFFRYRVGVLGFLHPGYTDDIRSNFGLLDQLAALQWVRENIKGFGGDEKNICLMGFDLDAAFVGVLALSPFSQAYGGLFHRLILLNGSPLSPVSINHRPLETTVHMARALNCPSHEIHDMNGELLRCLRQRQLDQLLGAAYGLGSSLFNNHFAPSVDGKVVKDVVGNINSVYADAESLKELLGRYDILCGLAEGTILPNIGPPSLWNNLDLDTFVTAVLRLALQLDSSTEPNDSLKDELKRALMNEYGDPHPFIRDILADFLTVFPMTNLLKLHSQTGKNTYFYVSKNYNPLGKTKVRPKNNDISYIFSNSVYKWKYIDYGQPNADLQPYELLITYISNFVRSGDPNPRELLSSPSTIWPKYGSEKGSYLQFELLRADNTKTKLNLTHFQLLALKILKVDVKWVKAPSGREVVMKREYRSHSMNFWFHVFPAILKNSLNSEQLNEWESNSDSRFPVHFVKPGRGIPPRVTVPGTSGGTSQGVPPDDVEVISAMTQNTVVMVGGFLLVLNLLCFMGLFYQRQRLKRTELRFRRRYLPERNGREENVVTREQETTEASASGGGHTNPSDFSEAYGYIGQVPMSQPGRAPRALMDTLSETETDNGFGTDFLGPNYDPRTKVTRWMFQQNRHGSRGDSFEHPDQEHIPMTSVVPYGRGGIPSKLSGTSHPSHLMTTPLLSTQQPYYTHPFQPSIPISDIPYADSRATSPSVVNYNCKVQTPPPGFNNNLTTNNFNNPRRTFVPSPSNSGTTTLSNPESQHRRSKMFFPMRNSVIVQEVDLEEYPIDDRRLVVTADLEVQSSKPKLVPVKIGTLTRSVGVGDTSTIGNGGADVDDSLPLLPPLKVELGKSNPSPSASNRQGQKVTFAAGI